MSQFSKTDQRRITFLSLLSSASNLTDSIDLAYVDANEILQRMEEDGFFEEAPASRPTAPSSSVPNRGSSRPASPSRPSSRGRDQGNQPFSGQLRDPDGPPTEKQVGAALKLTSDYTEDELWEMTKQQVSDLISDLKG